MDSNYLPDPEGTFIGLSNVGYTDTGAVLDIIDNSFDAGAENIYVSFREEDREWDLFIADDGCGMDKKTLTRALSVGAGERDRFSDSEMGRFGMGLLCAGLALGDRLEVVTLKQGGELIAGHFDISNAVTDWHPNTVAKATDSQEALFASAFPHGRPESGTLVRITGTGGKMTLRGVDQLRKSLPADIGLTYHNVLGLKAEVHCSEDAGKSWAVIQPHDPLYRSWSQEPGKTELVSLTGADGKPAEVQISWRLVPNEADAKQVLKEDVKTQFSKRSMATQGVYFVRNNRGIGGPVPPSLFGIKAHNSLNDIRLEVKYNGSVDHIMHTAFTKESVNPEASMQTRIRTAFEDARKASAEAKAARQAASVTGPARTKQAKSSYQEAEKAIRRGINATSLPQQWGKVSVALHEKRLTGADRNRVYVSKWASGNPGGVLEVTLNTAHARHKELQCKISKSDQYLTAVEVGCLALAEQAGGVIDTYAKLLQGALS